MARPTALGALLLLAHLSCSEPIGHPPTPPGATRLEQRPDPLLTTSLGASVFGAEWNALAAKYRMKYIVLKADDGLVSRDQGIEVMARDRRIWRIVLTVNPQPDAGTRAYPGPLPFGVNRNATPTDLARNLGPANSDDPTRASDRWMIYRRDGIAYIFSFASFSTLEYIMIELDTGDGNV